MDKLKTSIKSKKLAKLYSMNHVKKNYYDFIKQNKKVIDGIIILASMDKFLLYQKF